jgi:hypothetical protein
MLEDWKNRLKSKGVKLKNKLRDQSMDGNEIDNKNEIFCKETKF